MKVGTEWKYLYRAVDSAGQTIEFMLSAKRDVSTAKRFFKRREVELLESPAQVELAAERWLEARR